MSGISQLGTSVLINGVTCVGFILAFSILKSQPMNSRVYFPAWYKNRLRQPGGGSRLRKYLNLDAMSYLHSFDWMRECYVLSESELIQHAGLDAAVFLRIFTMGLKVFLPMLFFCLLVLVPVNYTDDGLAKSKAAHPEFVYTDLDRFTISNVNDASKRLWAHLISAYVFTAWTCTVLYTEYRTVVVMRIQFLATQRRKADEFTVLVRQVPTDKNQSLSVSVERFFRVNHPEYYATHQVVYNTGKLPELVSQREKYENEVVRLEAAYGGKTSKRPTTKKGYLHLCGDRVDKIEYLKDEIKRLSCEIVDERRRVLQNTDAVMPAAFVTFFSRWGAAVCAQTQQTRYATTWLTEWAPEPRDVYWGNLAIPYVELGSRKLGTTLVVVLLVVFFMFPVTLVQSLANLDGIEKTLPFLAPVVRQKVINNILQGFLPGLSLKIFLLIVPYVLMMLSKFEGHVSKSKLDRSTSAKYFLVMVVNVFFGNVIVGSAFQQLKLYLESPPLIPSTLGRAIPTKATFFITYIMVDGWSSLALEILRLFPLIFFHVRAAVFLRTEKDFDKATVAGNVCNDVVFPQLLLYFLLGLVYAISSPLILVFLILFFAFGFIIYRHQIINVYQSEYESAAAFWPHIHHRILAALIVMQITLIGLFSIKKAPLTTPFLVPLPVITYLFFLYCRKQFEPAFKWYPLQDAKSKDILEHHQEPCLDIITEMGEAYLDPTLKSACSEEGTNAHWPAPVPVRNKPWRASVDSEIV